MNSLSPRIVCAAMLMDNGDIVVGIRHFSPDMRAIMLKAYGEGYHRKVKEQGFVDQFGKFYNRKDAWNLAKTNKQIIRATGWETTPKIEELEDNKVLFSENLY
jgi:hypothetical protein